MNGWQDSRVERKTLGENNSAHYRRSRLVAKARLYRTRYITHERIAGRVAKARVESQTAARWLKCSERKAEGRTREGTHRTGNKKELPKSGPPSQSILCCS
jgi:hypothetical protein